MRIFPRNIALGVVAGALGYLAFTAEPGGPPARMVAPLVEGFDASAVRELRFADADGAEARLRRGEDGGWTVVSLHGAPAVGDVVEGVLRKLGGVTDLDLLTGEDATEAEVSRAYGLGADEAVRITATGDGGAALADVYTARAPGSGAAAFLREADSFRVVRAPAFPGDLPADPARWFKRSPLLSETGFGVQRLTVRGTAMAGPLEVTVPEPNVFEDAAGERLPRRGVEELLAQLRILPDGVLGPLPAEVPGGGDVPLEIAVTPLTGAPYRILVLEVGDPAAGAEPARALRSDIGVVYSVDSERVARVIEVARALSAAGQDDGE